LCAVALAAAGIAPAAAQSGRYAAQQPRYAEPGAYGGGLIEYLMTGSVPGGGAPAPYADPRARVYPSAHPSAAAYPSAAYGASAPGRAWQPERHAALPQAPTAPRAEAWPYPGAADPMASSPPQGAPREEERIGRGLDPRFQRQEVAFPGPQRPGTIVVDTPNKYLYLVQPGGRALRYGIGVGRPGFAWAGLKTVSRKAEWPDWTPPKEMLARRPDLPRHMAGGPENPLGARALYLGSSLYRIHGTNEPHTIGQSVSSGCIRMMNADVVDLYERVPVGTRVEVL
jgi:lipoprotein-anchoring transpeptidase ErfK/SrfK